MAWNVGLGLRNGISVGTAPVVSAPVPAVSLPVAALVPRPALDGTDDEAETIAVFEAARDSVVFISTTDRITDPWRNVARERPRGSGSGFLWDDAGHVVTNWHVLEGATTATVRLADGLTVPATLVGATPLHDLAVLQIDASDRSALPRGSSRDLRVGQKVLAIGNPFGFDWTLTTGVVSALDRDLPATRPGGSALRGLIQTDAAINPGNSGGPLLDRRGRLIGVTTAIYSASGASAGIGLAVPVDTLMRVVPQLIRTGRYAPPGIGIETDARVNAMAARRGYDGVLVLEVASGSPAARAGLRPARMTRGGLVPGDSILSVDDTPVETPAALTAAFDARQPGDEVRLTLRRDRDVIAVSLRLQAPARE